MNFDSPPNLSVVPLKSGTITVTRGKRTGKRRPFAKSQHLTGRILLRTGTNTQGGDYPCSVLFKKGTDPRLGQVTKSFMVCLALVS